MKKFNLLILIFLTFSISCQCQSKVISKGSVYNWIIFQITDNNITETCFSFTSGNLKNRMEIGITTQDEMKNLISRLRQFAKYPIKGEYDYKSDCFTIKKHSGTSDIELGGYDEKTITISRINAIGLALELENNLKLLN